MFDTKTVLVILGYLSGIFVAFVGFSYVVFNP
jgi:hypothetical protein